MEWNEYRDFLEQSHRVPELYRTIIDNGFITNGFLSLGYDFRVVSPDFMKELADERFADWLTVKPEYANDFLPFATSWGADNYCFFYGGHSEPSIVRLSPTGPAQYLDASFADFIFDILLQPTGLEENNDQLLPYLELHKPYLKPEHYEIVRQVYSHPAKREELLKRHAPFPQRYEEIEVYDD